MQVFFACQNMLILILWGYLTTVESKDFGCHRCTDVLLQVCSVAEATGLFRNVMVTYLIRELKVVLR